MLLFYVTVICFPKKVFDFLSFSIIFYCCCYLSKYISHIIKFK